MSNLVQLEQVDDVCIVCEVRHVPKWLEEAMEQDPWLKRAMKGTVNPYWLNVHDFTKRAFVPLESK